MQIWVIILVMFGGEFFLLIKIKFGARRRIGNGENTLVWRDPWPPGVANVYMLERLLYDQ